jgi:hypothetical protein
MPQQRHVQNKNKKGKKNNNSHGVSGMQRKPKGKAQMSRRNNSGTSDRGSNRRSKPISQKNTRNIRVSGADLALQTGAGVKSYETPGQHFTIDMKVDYNPESLWMIAAVFVNYALSVGFTPQRQYGISQYHLAFQALFLNAMQGWTQTMDTAPLSFWLLVNAMKPKKGFKYRGLEHSFQFLNARGRVITASSLFNITFGNIDSAPDSTGQHPIREVVYDLPSDNDAVKFVQEIFAYTAKFTPNVPQTTMGEDDCSIYAWGGKYVTGQLDTNFCDWSSASLEVPISAHWLAKLSLGVNTYNQTGQPRLPKFTQWGFGNAAQHIGIRLMRPAFCRLSYNHATINLKSVDLFAMGIKAATTDYFSNLKLKESNKPGGNVFPTPIAALDGFRYLRFYVLACLANFAKYMTLWAGARIGSFNALRSGVTMDWNKFFNNMNMNAQIAENCRSLQPVWNATCSEFIIPYPCMANNSATIFFTQWSSGFATNAAYGGVDFDYCNMSIGNTKYNISIGSDIGTNMAVISSAEQQFSNISPVGSARGNSDVVYSLSTLDNFVSTTSGASFQKSMVSYLTKQFGYTPAFARQFVNALAANSVVVLNDDPTFCDTTLSYTTETVGDTGSMNQSLPFNQSNVLPTVPIRRLSPGVSLYDDPIILRLMHNVGAVVQPDQYVTDKEPYYADQIGQINNYVMDPTNDILSEYSQILKNRANNGEGGALSAINPNSGFLRFIDGIVSVIPGIGAVNEALEGPVSSIRKVVNEGKRLTYDSRKHDGGYWTTGGRFVPRR